MFLSFKINFKVFIIFIFSFFLFFLLFSINPVFAVLDTVTETVNDFVIRVLGGVVSGVDIVFGLALNAFDFIAEFGIYNIGEFWGGGDSAGSRSLGTFWQYIRDLVNLFIVILFIVTAFLTLSESFGFNRKSLIGLLLAAIFVNFSAFVVLALVDVSNVLAAAFYNEFLNVSLSTVSLNSLSSIFFSADDIVWNTVFTIGLAISTALIIGALFYLAVILLVRILYIFILVITSPIAALFFFFTAFGGSISVFEDFIEKWKQTFLFVFISPTIIFISLIVLFQIYDRILDGVLDGNVGGTFGSGEGSWQLFVQIIVANLIFVLGAFAVGGFLKNLKNFVPGWKGGAPGTEGYKNVGRQTRKGAKWVGGRVVDTAVALPSVARAGFGAADAAVKGGANLFKNFRKPGGGGVNPKIKPIPFSPPKPSGPSGGGGKPGGVGNNSAIKGLPFYPQESGGAGGSTNNSPPAPNSPSIDLLEDWATALTQDGSKTNSSKTTEPIIEKKQQGKTNSSETAKPVVEKKPNTSKESDTTKGKIEGEKKKKGRNDIDKDSVWASHLQKGKGENNKNGGSGGDI